MICSMHGFPCMEGYPCIQDSKKPNPPWGIVTIRLNPFIKEIIGMTTLFENPPMPPFAKLTVGHFLAGQESLFNSL